MLLLSPSAGCSMLEGTQSLFSETSFFTNLKLREQSVNFPTLPFPGLCFLEVHVGLLFPKLREKAEEPGNSYRYLVWIFSVSDGDPVSQSELTCKQAVWQGNRALSRGWAWQCLFRVVINGVSGFGLILKRLWHYSEYFLFFPGGYGCSTCSVLSLCHTHHWPFSPSCTNCTKSPSSRVRESGKQLSKLPSTRKRLLP